MEELDGDAKEPVKTSFYRKKEGCKRHKMPGTWKVVKKSSRIREERPPCSDHGAHH